MKKCYFLYTGEPVYTMDGENWFMETKDGDIVPTNKPRLEDIAIDATVL